MHNLIAVFTLSSIFYIRVSKLKILLLTQMIKNTFLVLTKTEQSMPNWTYMATSFNKGGEIKDHSQKSSNIYE